MIDVNVIIKSKEIEERINKESLNKVIEDFMKNPYELIENFMIIPDKEKSKFNKVLS